MPPDDNDPPPDHDDRDRDDGLGESLRARLEKIVPELVKKTFQAGMGAVFQTEEGIRRFAREVSVPESVSNVAGYIADSADGAKDKVFEVIARETREFLANLNVGEELAKLLTTLSFEIKTEIRFIPNSERFAGAEPDVKASVRLKRNDRPDDKDKDAKDAKDKDAKESKDSKESKDKDKDKDGKDGPDEGQGRPSRLRFWRRDSEAPPVGGADANDGGGNEEDGHDK